MGGVVDIGCLHFFFPVFSIFFFKTEMCNFFFLKVGTKKENAKGKRNPRMGFRRASGERPDHDRITHVIWALDLEN